MINHQWTILCESSSVDKDSNNLSIFNIIEKIEIQKNDEILDKVMNVKFAFQIVSMWNRSDASKKNDEKIFVSFLDQDGNELAKNEILVVFDKNIKTMRTRINIPGLQIKNLGIHQFIIQTRNKEKFIEVVKVPLEIDFTKN